MWRETGRYGGWPANHGIWSWGDEILVGFTAGVLKTDDMTRHPIDRSAGERHVLSRSLDGGRTWRLEEPAALQPPPRPERRAVTGEPLRLPALQTLAGPIDFTAPGLALTFRAAHGTAGAWLFASTDRGRTWQGPYAVPAFDAPGLDPRTDYLVLGRHELLVGMTALKTNGKEGRPFTMRTRDGGLTWERLGWIGPETDGYRIMPATLLAAEARRTGAPVHGHPPPRGTGLQPRGLPQRRWRRDVARDGRRRRRHGPRQSRQPRPPRRRPAVLRLRLPRRTVRDARRGECATTARRGRRRVRCARAQPTGTSATRARSCGRTAAWCRSTTTTTRRARSATSPRQSGNHRRQTAFVIRPSASVNPQTLPTVDVRLRSADLQVGGRHAPNMEPPMNRRSFLTHSAAALAASTLPTQLHGQQPAARRRRRRVHCRCPSTASSTSRSGGSPVTTAAGLRTTGCGSGATRSRSASATGS